MKTLAPPTASGNIAEAHQLAIDTKQPIFYPVNVFSDDRGWSIMNQFQGVLSPEGQINFSIMYPQVIKAWHRHALQTDFWLCVTGSLKVGIQREEDDTTWLTVIGEKKPGVLIIPPPLWHGAATVGPTNAGLIYFVTHAYNPDNPDEERRAYNEPADFPWGTRHG